MSSLWETLALQYQMEIPMSNTVKQVKTHSGNEIYTREVALKPQFQQKGNICIWYFVSDGESQAQ